MGSRPLYPLSTVCVSFVYVISICEYVRFYHCKNESEYARVCISVMINSSLCMPDADTSHQRCRNMHDVAQYRAIPRS